MPWQPLPSSGEEPEALGETVQRLARSLGAPSAGVSTSVFTDWADIVGVQVAAHCQPSTLRDRVLTVTVTDPAAVQATGLVVYAVETEAALTVRLAWQVEAGAGQTWTVFVDAVTGQLVGTRQNFQT